MTWLGKPDYEKRSMAVTEVDLNILQAADKLLSNEDNWFRDNDRNCRKHAQRQVRE
jgi:hypothetical protein